jgi:hypothetical protein
MRRFRFRKVAGIATLAAAAVGGVSAYAFTASNTVPDHLSGAGSGVVGGYSVTGYTNYTFSADGTTMVSVSFDLDHAASDVAVALSNGAPVHADWADCGATSGGSNSITDCAFPSPVPVANGTQLSIAAVSQGSVIIAP